VAKNRAETAVKASGLPWVILRPSWVYGPGDRSLSKFVEFARFLPFMPVIGAGESRVAPVFIEDLAQACVAAVTQESAVGQTLEIGGPRNMTMNEVQKTVLDVLGKNKPLVHLPIWMMKTTGAVVNATLPTPPFSPEAIDFITMDVPVDAKPAESLLGIKFRDLKTALESYLLN
jgi:NADH dehydrogenase